MSRPTARRPRRRAAPHPAASTHRLAVAGGAALAVAVLGALPVPAAAPGVAAAMVANPSPATVFPVEPPASGALLHTAATENAAGTAAAAAAAGPGTAVGQPAASLVRSSLAAGGIPAVALAAYRRAAAAAPLGCGIDWSLLAAIGRVESNHGRFGGAILGADGRSTPPVLGPVLDGSSTALVADTDGGRLDGDTRYDRAVGPMQFIPSTWARYAVDGDGDGVADPFDIDDAAAAAARYLCVAGGDLATPAGQARAVLAYNHSDSYVATVLTLAAAYAGGHVPTLPGPMPLPTVEPANPAPPPALGRIAPPAPPAAPPSSDSPVVLADGPTPLAPATTTPPGSPAPDSTTPDATTPHVTTPHVTTPDVTTPPTTTAATTTAATTTAATTTAATTTAATTTAATTTSAPTAGTTGGTATGTATGGCPVVPHVVLDVVNGTGDPAVAQDVTARLQAAGLTIGTVGTDRAATGSALQYPAAARTDAGQLATALGLPRADVQQADVSHLTLVLAGGGAASLQALVDRMHCPA